MDADEIMQKKSLHTDRTILGLASNTMTTVMIQAALVRLQRWSAADEHQPL
jgi:hypothetical protein